MFNFKDNFKTAVAAGNNLAAGQSVNQVHQQLAASQNAQATGQPGPIFKIFET